jgi:hypothetical protein
MNATGHHCVTPKDFFRKNYYNQDVVVDTQSPEHGTTVKTTVTTVTKHPMTWGPGDLMLRACPGSCPADGKRNLTGYCASEEENPAPSNQDCCMKVMWDFGTKYLGIGPSATCSEFRNLGSTCSHVPPVTVAIDVATGGSVKLRSGAGVDIPGGAISSDQCSNPCAISVAMPPPAATGTVLRGIKKENPLWTGLKMQTGIVTFKPEGLKFKEAVTACVVVLSDAAIVAYKEDVKIYQFELDNGTIIGDKIVPDSYNRETGLLCFRTLHFSSYGGIDYDVFEVSTKSSSSGRDDLPLILGEFLFLHAAKTIISSRVLSYTDLFRPSHLTSRMLTCVPCSFPSLLFRDSLRLAWRHRPDFLRLVHDASTPT